MTVWHIRNDVGSAFRWFPTSSSSMTNSATIYNRWIGEVTLQRGVEIKRLETWQRLLELEEWPARRGVINNNLVYVSTCAVCVYVCVSVLIYIYIYIGIVNDVDSRLCVYKMRGCRAVMKKYKNRMNEKERPIVHT